MAKKVPFNYCAAKRPGSSLSSAAYSLEPGISVRTEMDRDIYNQYRPLEKVPYACSQEDYRRIMLMCLAAYEKTGVVRSVIDMMSEFAAEGVEIIHPDEGPNAFYKAWSKKVKLEDRTERFLSWLFKTGNVVVRRNYGKIPDEDLRKIRNNIKNYNPDDDSLPSGRIPLSYTLYNPATIELIGGQAGALSSEKIYAIRVPYQFLDGIMTPRNELERQVFDKLPLEIKNALIGKSTNGILHIPIPNDKLYVGYYKKDDSDIWGKSFIYSILEDIIYNNKLKLAKTAGLDGWMNVVRLWKVGDHKTPGYAPDPTAGARLQAILEANTGGGAADIIWSSDIDMSEYYPPVEKLVNFEENLHNILLGLGVPEGLVGGKAEKSAGMSTTYLGLKNLIKRLEAGRRAVRDWLEGEIDIIQKEMGFKKRPTIRFAHSDLYDDQVYFNLLLQLVDRNILSDETVLERVNEFVSIERSRVSKEESARSAGDMPPKASPYHKPDLKDQQKHEIKKIREQKKMDAGGDGENSSNMQKKVPKIPRQAGRPTNSPDTVKRKRGPNRPGGTTSANLLLEAAKIYDYVDIFLKDRIPDLFGVANSRFMTSEQESQLDSLRITIFAHILPFSDLSDDNLEMACNAKEGPINNFNYHYDLLLREAGSEKLTNDQKKMLRIQAYVNAWLGVYNLDEAI